MNSNSLATISKSDIGKMFFEHIIRPSVRLLGLTLIFSTFSWLLITKFTFLADRSILAEAFCLGLFLAWTIVYGLFWAGIIHNFLALQIPKIFVQIISIFLSIFLILFVADIEVRSMTACSYENTFAYLILLMTILSAICSCCIVIFNPSKFPNFSLNESPKIKSLAPIN